MHNRRVARSTSRCGLIMLLWWPILATATASTLAAPPNVILVMADDQGWGDTGYNGHSHLKTPHLDRLAADGLVFRRWYAGAPVCSPTRGSCLTGRHPYRYGILTANRGHLPRRERTLPELLVSRGYRTGHFGKWHVGTLTTEVEDSNRGGPRNKRHFSPPWKNGFQVCFSTEAKVPTWDPLLKPQNAGRRWWNPITDTADAVPYGTRYWNQRGKPVNENTRGDDSRVIMDRAVPFIESAAKDKSPFLAVIWFHAPHLPVVAGPKYTALYADQPDYHRHYYGCITALDEQVGRLRATLDRLGIAENTMLWYSADNGPEGNDKAPGRTRGLRGRKRSLYEGGIRVPGIVTWPAVVAAGQTTDSPGVTSDYLPTVLDVLGVLPPRKFTPDGISLLPVLRGQRDWKRPQPILFESGGQTAAIDNRFKLVRHTGGGKKKKGQTGAAGKPTIELFDLLADPRETANVAADHPRVVEELSGKLKTWRASCRVSAARNADR
ncbi:MAG: sulfatase-like hydrolase/transferase [Planctomycetaceae bacterium]|nr:sulfatase-like hydrolase/transferase [Planctomycetaceae bacterium]